MKKMRRITLGPIGFPASINPNASNPIIVNQGLDPNVQKSDSLNF